MITYQDAKNTFQEVGIMPGCNVLIHASIKAIGYVNGGAETIVSALLDSIGPEGTLIVPTFVFTRKPNEIPVIDPIHDPCNTGSICEAARKHPDASHSTAYTHRFSAIGPLAKWICGADPRISPFDPQGTFGRILDSKPRILLIGVAYTHCTAGHFCEYLNHVDYRATYSVPAYIKQPDGNIQYINMVQYSPRRGIPYPPRDFNRSGAIMEEHGLVQISTLGNAYIRSFSMADYVNLVTSRYAVGDNLLTYASGQTSGTILKDGYLLDQTYFDEKNQITVHSVRSLVKPENSK